MEVEQGISEGGAGTLWSHATIGNHAQGLLALATSTSLSETRGMWCVSTCPTRLTGDMSSVNASGRVAPHRHAYQHLEQLNLRTTDITFGDDLWPVLPPWCWHHQFIGWSLCPFHFKALEQRSGSCFEVPSVLGERVFLRCSVR